MTVARNRVSRACPDAYSISAFASIPVVKEKQSPRITSRLLMMNGA
jgi:hypothetical protein